MSFNNVSQSFIQAAVFPEASQKDSISPLVTTSTQEKKQIDNLSAAADYLCRASGVFEAVANLLLSNAEGQLGVVDHDTGDRDRPSSGSMRSMNRKVNFFKTKASKTRGSPKAPLECGIEVMKGLAM